MGEVFVARELATSRKLALKRLLPAAQKRQALFRAEYHLLARLKHPFIIEVYDFGVDRDLPYYTMELLDGYDLREAPHVEPEEGCRILRDVATSLALLHAQRLLHRDVSPRNVRRTTSGVCKLIDFGTMVPFGAPPNVAGTPPFISPEAWEGGELDQRADLYSLGALAYWLFSRRLPGATGPLGRAGARREAPPLLRKARADLPPELEELVMSLLEHDPSQRPSSAQEVIARLSVIGKLPASDASSLAGAHLGSSRFVGQKRALAKAEDLLRRALVCSGGGGLVEGAEGAGKTRFLQEVSLLAQTHGFSVVRALAPRSASASNLARDLYRGLKRAAPDAEELVPAAERELLAALERPEHTAAAGAAESRGQVVWALAAYLRVVARQGPWLVAVDDLDPADELSVGLIAALAAMAENLPLLVLVSAAAGRKGSSARAFEALAERTPRIMLHELDARRTRRLVSDLLGRVPNRERLVDFLYRGAHGNPAMTIELCRFLLERGVIRYVDGSFVLPESEIREQLPASAAQTFSLRLQHLSSGARELANLIATCRAGASLELCLLASAAPDDEVLSALDELVSHGVLTGSGREYVFTQEALRSALRQALSREQTTRLHERLAAAFEALGGRSELSKLEAALHLVHTGREREGAERLARLAPALIEAGVAWQDAIEGLEKALEVLERQAAPLADRLAVRTHLARASYTHDYRLAERYAVSTMAQLRAWFGMPTVEKLRRFLPAPCGALLCILIVAFRWLFWPRARRGPGPIVALQYCLRVMMSTMGIHLTALDGPASTKLFEQLWMLRELSLIPALNAVYQAAGALLMQTYGREVQLRVRLGSALALLEKPVPLMQEAERQDLRVGLLLSGGINEAYRLGGNALQRADQLAALGTRIAQASAHRIRFTYYIARGMRERAEEYRRELDIHGLQGGTTWQVEWFAIPMEGMTAARFGDLVGAAQALSRLERLAAEVPALEAVRDMLRIGNCLGRGEHAQVIQLGQAFAARHAPGSRVGWGTVYAALAASLNHCQRHAEARELCARAFAVLTKADLEYDHMYGGLLREHAVACAGTGAVEEALAIAGEYIARLEAAGEHALLAYALECRARLAHMIGDQELFASTLSAMREASERSGSSAVIHQVARMIQASLREQGADDDEPPQPAEDDGVTTSLTSVATPPGGLARTRRSTLLRRIMQRAKAPSALVFVLRHGAAAPLLAAATGQPVAIDALAPVLQALLPQISAAHQAGGTHACELNVAKRTFALATLPCRSAREPSMVLLLERRAEGNAAVPPTLISRLAEGVRSELSLGQDFTSSDLDSDISQPSRH
jgi:tetratricopeptide (TPR) repeat protein